MKKLLPLLLSLLLLCACKEDTGYFYENDGLTQHTQVTAAVTTESPTSLLKELEVEIYNNCGETIFISEALRVEALRDGQWQTAELSIGTPYGEPGLLSHSACSSGSTVKRIVKFEEMRTTHAYHSYTPLTSGEYRIWFDFAITDDIHSVDTASGATVVAYFTVAPPAAQ